MTEDVAISAKICITLFGEIVISVNIILDKVGTV